MQYDSVKWQALQHSIVSAFTGQGQSQGMAENAEIESLVVVGEMDVVVVMLRNKFYVLYVMEEYIRSVTVRARVGEQSHVASVMVSDIFQIPFHMSRGKSRRQKTSLNLMLRSLADCLVTTGNEKSGPSGIISCLAGDR